MLYQGIVFLIELKKKKGKKIYKYLLKNEKKKKGKKIYKNLLKNEKKKVKKFIKIKKNVDKCNIRKCSKNGKR
jgi:hypothetical protein